MDVSNDGSSLISGMFFGTANFGNSISLSSNNDADGFTAKMNADGTYDVQHSDGNIAQHVQYADSIEAIEVDSSRPDSSSSSTAHSMDDGHVNADHIAPLPAAVRTSIHSCWPSPCAAVVGRRRRTTTLGR